MECDECDRPNLFTCIEKYGVIPAACHEIHSRLMGVFVRDI
jgi:hypothetical protein